jgi:hypothetical protein
MSKRYQLALIALLILTVAAACRAQTPEIRGIGPAFIDDRTSGAQELSGITFAGAVEGKRNTFLYYAVSDDTPKVFALHIKLNMKTGAIESASVVAVIKLAAGSDLEGIAYNPKRNTIFVSDEAGPVIREYYLKSDGTHKAGDVAKTLSVPDGGLPPVFAAIRPNLSLESLSSSANGSALWTANEEALKQDGDASTTDHGSVVRLLKLASDLKPAGQWVYTTDPIESSPPKGDSRERSGVSDVLALPDGRLIVLERELDVRKLSSLHIPSFRNRLYQVDFTDATEVSGFTDGLIGKDYTPVKKTLLWEKHFPLENYEGIALGPQLSDGTFSLVLISDNEKGLLQQGLYALKISL